MSYHIIISHNLEAAAERAELEKLRRRRGCVEDIL